MVVLFKMFQVAKLGILQVTLQTTMLSLQPVKVVLSGIVIPQAAV